jgi:hypothetical protein
MAPGCAVDRLTLVNAILAEAGPAERSEPVEVPSPSTRSKKKRRTLRKRLKRMIRSVGSG